MKSSLYVNFCIGGVFDYLKTPKKKVSRTMEHFLFGSFFVESHPRQPSALNLCRVDMTRLDFFEKHVSDGVTLRQMRVCWLNKRFLTVRLGSSSWQPGVFELNIAKSTCFGSTLRYVRVIRRNFATRVCFGSFSMSECILPQRSILRRGNVFRLSLSATSCASAHLWNTRVCSIR